MTDSVVEQRSLFEATYEDRFIQEYAGRAIYGDPKVAIIELVANAWDAGATKVDIRWPSNEAEQFFSITDNGHGMTEEEFLKRWMKMAYDRQKHQGVWAAFPPEVSLPKRRVYGKNGKGRLAGFCFGSEYFVKTCKDGNSYTFRVSQGSEHPLLSKLEFIGKSDQTGTTVYANEIIDAQLTSEDVRTEIGMRFLTDPNFQVSVDGVKVDFLDIPPDQKEEFLIELEGLEPITIIAINLDKSDRTTKLHGVAWQVNHRLVGECSWKGFSNDTILDGRTRAAKRYTFIVQASCLADCVLPDWTDFYRNHSTFKSVHEAVKEKIESFLLETTKESREQVFNEIKLANRSTIQRMGPLNTEIWCKFITNVQEKCPSINEKELLELASILAKLEASKSKYSIIYLLSQLSCDQLDDLTQILEDWNIDMAKIVLDELQKRLSLINILKDKVVDHSTDEVQELQPLFHQGLWIFGPEFETIEFTSNQGMTQVISKLFNGTTKGTRNRPDFAVLTDGSVGFYSYDAYDEQGGEVGVKELVIIELKRPGISISAEQKEQCWKYVKELREKGHLVKGQSRTRGFVLGSQLDQLEAEPTKHGDDVIITPLLFSTVLRRAESRVHKLFDKVKHAPFLNKEVLDEFLSCGIQNEQIHLF